MSKKYRILAILYFIILSIIVFNNKDMLKGISTTLNYVSCGSSNGIPRPVPQLTTIAYTVLLVVTPIVLIIFSILTLVKSMASGNADEITKTKGKLIKKIIITVIIFLSSALVQFVIIKVASNSSDKSSVSKCLRCFIAYSEGNCPVSSTGNNVYTGSKKSSNETHSVGTPDNPKSSNNKTSSDAVILVGDSRTVQMCGFTSSSMYSGETCRDYIAVAQGGKGSIWFRDEAVPAITKILKDNSSKKYNIVILMGANDVGQSSGVEQNAVNIYKSKLPELAKGDWKNQNITFVMLPCGDQAMANANGMGISQSQIDAFNKKIEEFIKSENISNLSYCKIEDVPRKYLADGVHYTSEGSEFYYEQVKNKCA